MEQFEGPGIDDSERLNRSLRSLITVFGVWVCAALLVALLATALMKESYSAVSTLQAPGISDFASVLGLRRSSNEGEEEATRYIELASDDRFKGLVLADIRADESLAAWERKELSGLTSDDYSIRVSLVEGTSMIELQATGATPQKAKLIADAATETLVRKNGEINASQFEDMSARVDQQLEPIDEQLETSRKRLYQISGSLDLRSPTKVMSEDAELEAASIDDEIDELMQTRETYSDVIAKANLNDWLNNRSLEVIYPPVTPGSPSSPSWPRNIAIGILAGIILATGHLTAVDYIHRSSRRRQTDEETDETGSATED